MHAHLLRSFAPCWALSAALFGAYCLASCALPVPGCSQPQQPRQSPGCNMAGYVDGVLLRPQHLYPWPTCNRVRLHAQWWVLSLACQSKRVRGAQPMLPPPNHRLPQHLPPWPICRGMRSLHAGCCSQVCMGVQASPPCSHFDPEGLFTTLGGASASTFLGLYFGQALQHPAHSTAGVLAPAALLGAAGLALQALGWAPLNKNLWSPSFVLLTAGVAGGLLHALHVTLDRGHPSMVQSAVRTCAQPLRWLGLNAILCFAGDEFLFQALPCVFWQDRSRNLISWLKGGFQWAPPGRLAQPAFAAADAVFWTAVAGWLYRQRCFFKV